MTISPLDAQALDPVPGFPGDIGRRADGQGILGESTKGFSADFLLGLLVRASAAIVLCMIVGLIVVLAVAAVPSIRTFGAKFLVTSTWRPNEREITKHDIKGNIVRDEDGEPVMVTLPAEFGALPVIYGTAVSSLLALLIAVPVSLGAALFLVRIGPWLTPTSVKCGILGMLITGVLMHLFGRSAISLAVTAGFGIVVSGIVAWAVSRLEDPRVGARWQLEVPLCLGLLAASAFLIFRFSGVRLFWSTTGLWSVAGAAVITGFVHGLASSAIAIISFLIEFLAAIPSIAYGIWGLFVVGPCLQNYIESPLNRFFDWVPFLRFLHTEGYPSGRDMFCAGLILAIMILPIITAISRDILRAVPRIQIEGTQALGATWWQSSWSMLRYGRSGLFGAIMLGLARAAGETMAVAMVIGNDPHIHLSIFQPAQTMAGLIANEFREVSTDLHRSALIEVALILLLMSLVFNIVARYLVVGKQARPGG